MGYASGKLPQEHSDLEGHIDVPQRIIMFPWSPLANLFVQGTEREHPEGSRAHDMISG
jgi:hypothetical protein